MSTTLAPQPPALPRASRTSSLLRVRELGIALLIVVVFLVATLKNPAFAHAHSVQQLLTGAAIIALLCVGAVLAPVFYTVLGRAYDRQLFRDIRAGLVSAPRQTRVER